MTTHRTGTIEEITKLSLKSIEDLKWKFRRNPDVLSLLDEQTDLLMDNAAQARAQENLRMMVRAGKMSYFQATIILATIAIAAKETLARISLNGMVIEHVLRVQAGQQVIEA